MELRIMEWNINQRMNFAGKDMPNWIADVIANEEADIVSLTEVYKGNNWEHVKASAFNSNYVVFETSNNLAGQNEVAIAINLNKLEVIYAKTYYPGTKGIPDYLEVKCRDREKFMEFVFVCVRIHASVNDDIKRKEFEHIMTASKDNNKVIICGDFNNYRRGFVNDQWCLTEINNICDSYHFTVKTPAGSSIYEEKPKDVAYEFPEDHFLLKGIEKRNFILLPYDRDFTEKDKKIYKWGRDFQGNRNMNEFVPAPFPDHAILKGKVKI